MKKANFKVTIHSGIIKNDLVFSIPSGRIEVEVAIADEVKSTRRMTLKMIPTVDGRLVCAASIAHVSGLDLSPVLTIEERPNKVQPSTGKPVKSDGRNAYRHRKLKKVGE